MPRTASVGRTAATPSRSRPTKSAAAGPPAAARPSRVRRCGTRPAPSAARCRGPSGGRNRGSSGAGAHGGVGALLGRGEADMALLVVADLAGPAGALDAPVVVELDAARHHRPPGPEEDGGPGERHRLQILRPPRCASSRRRAPRRGRPAPPACGRARPSRSRLAPPAPRRPTSRREPRPARRRRSGSRRERG